MEQKNVTSMVSANQEQDTQKMPYTSPKVTFVPSKVRESLSSKERRKGTFAVPLGCC